jgi:L-ascorbate metabolism protein UlaG (beta-lactamase superfamily)
MFDKKNNLVIQNLHEWLDVDPFPKPLMRGKKYICSEGLHGWNNALEGLQIFTSTQIKRLGRFLTLNQIDAFKYFAHNEKEEDIYKFDNTYSESKLSIQNIGHATQLLNVNGVMILTDPVFNGLNSVLYPARTRNGLSIDKLPKIDIIVISHNHRDHTDARSLKKLSKKYPDVKVLIPQGDKKLFIKLGYKKENISEIAWYNSINLHDINFTAVAANHWSGRHLFDHHHSAANGWLIISDNAILYFAGDTGKLNEKRIKSLAALIYVDCLKKPTKEIVFLMPDGPNRVRSMMERTHMSIIEALITTLQVAEKVHSIERFISSKDSELEVHTNEWWINKFKTVMMHHNRYELGLEIFNEGYWILEKMREELHKLKHLSIDEAKDILEKKSKYEKLKFNFWFRKNDDFIYDGLINLINFVEVQMEKNTFDEVLHFLDYLLTNVLNPKIGERIDV